MSARGGWLARAAAAVGVAGVLAAAAAVGGVGVAAGDALCDQMRDQYGPGWPCVNVPQYTPTTTTQPPMSPGVPQDPGSGGGNNFGASPGEGPGMGDGTPIIPAPGDAPAPPAPGLDLAPGGGDVSGGAGPADVPVGPDSSAGVDGGVRRTPAPVTVTLTPPAPAESVAPTPPQPPSSGGGEIPLGVWALIGAAGLISGIRTARGGSTRAQVGPSRMVLIHDETSPDTYRFAMNVPEGGTTRINPDGSATVYDRDGRVVSRVAKPWAFDAAGRPQRTWYEVAENGDLIQHVDASEDALYPILADPMAFNDPASPDSWSGQAAEASPTGIPEGAPEGFAGPEQPSQDAIAAQFPENPPEPITTEQLNAMQPGGMKIYNDEPAGTTTIAPGQRDWPDSVMWPYAEGPQPGEIYQRTNENGTSDTYRREVDPDGTVYDRPVTDVTLTEDGTRYEFEDGSYQEGKRLFRYDGVPEDQAAFDSGSDITPGSDPVALARADRWAIEQSGVAKYGPLSGALTPEVKRAMQRERWRSEGYEVRLTGDVDAEGNPIAEARKFGADESFYISQKIDRSLPERIELGSVSGAQINSSESGVGIAFFKRPDGVPDDFVDVGMRSPFADSFVGRVKIDPMQRGLTIRAQTVDRSRDGVVGVELIERDAWGRPKPGKSTGLDITGNQYYDVRVVGAYPVEMRAVTVYGEPAMQVTYAYEYEYTDHIRVNVGAIPILEFDQNWRQVAPEVLDRNGLRYPSPGFVPNIGE